MADLYATPSAAASFVSFLQEKKTSPLFRKGTKKRKRRFTLPLFPKCSLFGRIRTAKALVTVARVAVAVGANLDALKAALAALLIEAAAGNAASDGLFAELAIHRLVYASFIILGPLAPLKNSMPAFRHSMRSSGQSRLRDEDTMEYRRKKLTSAASVAST